MKRLVAIYRTREFGHFLLAGGAAAAANFGSRFLFDLWMPYAGAVIAAFGQHFAKSGRLPAELHAHLREAQDQRNIGDYGTGDGPGSEQTNEQIIRAEAFLKVARQRLAEDSSA